MRIKEKTVDLNPTEKPCEADIVTFKKTDLLRGAIKGHTATIVDMGDVEKWGYTILTDSNKICDFRREEFRLATPHDIERWKQTELKREVREARRAAERETRKTPPEMPELGEDAFKIWK